MSVELEPALFNIIICIVHFLREYTSVGKEKGLKEEKGVIEVKRVVTMGSNNKIHTLHTSFDLKWSDTVVIRLFTPNLEHCWVVVVIGVRSDTGEIACFFRAVLYSLYSTSQVGTSKLKESAPPTIIRTTTAVTIMQR